MTIAQSSSDGAAVAAVDAAKRARVAPDPLAHADADRAAEGVEVETVAADAAVAEAPISAADAYASAATFLSKKLSCLKLLDGVEVTVVISKPTESLQEVRYVRGRLSVAQR